MCYTICFPFITLIVCSVMILFLLKEIIIRWIAKHSYALICIYIILHLGQRQVHCINIFFLMKKEKTILIISLLLSKFLFS